MIDPSYLYVVTRRVTKPTRLEVTSYTSSYYL